MHDAGADPVRWLRWGNWLRCRLPILRRTWCSSVGRVPARRIAEQKAIQSKEKLSKATLHATLNQIKAFFQWLSRETGYKSRIQYSDADYFNLSAKDTRVATARREQNLGHENARTTLMSYGEVSFQRQAQILKELAAPQPEIISQDGSELAKAVVREMKNSGVALQVR